MNAPRLFLGQRGGNALYGLHTGATDGGTPFDLTARPDAIAPAGIGGECLFANLYLALTHEQPVTISVLPIVDGIELPAASRTISLPARATRFTEHLEIPLSIPYVRAGVVRSTYHPRGTWFTYRLTTIGGAGDLLGEAAGLEIEVLRETITPA